MIKNILPKPFKVAARSLLKRVKYKYREFNIKKPISRNENIKVILGAAETFSLDWYSTNESWLDITNASHWQNVFKGKQLISHAVAEHVFEHLTYEEAFVALKLIYTHLIPGGRIRIAVPDGYNTNEMYLKHVGINGIGDDAADHKQLLNSDALKILLEQAGFRFELVEGYKKDGQLIQTDYSPEDGYIRRSRLNSRPEDRLVWPFPDSETSLIVDGIKA